MSEKRQAPAEDVGEEGRNQEIAGPSSSEDNPPKRSLANRTAAYLRDLKCPCHVKQSLYYFIEVSLSVMLMLAVMTFNVWIVMAIVFGRGAGYFVFSRSTNNIVLGSDSDCCV